MDGIFVGYPVYLFGFQTARSFANKWQRKRVIQITGKGNPTELSTAVCTWNLSVFLYTLRLRSLAYFPLVTFQIHSLSISAINPALHTTTSTTKKSNKHNPSFYLRSSSLGGLSALDLSRPFSPSSITEREETCYVVSLMETNLVAFSLHLLRLQGREDNWFAVMANCSWSLGTGVEGPACLAKDGLQVSLRAL